MSNVIWTKGKWSIVIVSENSVVVKGHSHDIIFNLVSKKYVQMEQGSIAMPSFVYKEVHNYFFKKGDYAPKKVAPEKNLKVFYLKHKDSGYLGGMSIVVAGSLESAYVRTIHYLFEKGILDHGVTMDDLHEVNLTKYDLINLWDGDY